MRALWMIFLPMTAFAQMVCLSTEGEEFLFDVDPEQTLSETMERASHYLRGESSVVLEISKDQREISFWGSQMKAIPGNNAGSPRKYQSELLASEQQDIHYIVTTLANKTIVTIALLKTELEEAGNRIDHVHPFNFLKTIFTNDELKVSVRNIRGKGWIWSGFTAGLKSSLTAEALNNNLTEEMLADFAKAVSINVNKIRPLVNEQNWDGLLDFLIKEVPRSQSGNRFDF